MLDKVVRLNKQEALLIYTDKAPVKLFTADGTIDVLLSWFFDKRVSITYSEYTSAVNMGSEDTQTINLKAA